MENGLINRSNYRSAFRAN